MTHFSKTSNPNYSEFIHKSRYARWRDGLQKRENWEETVTRLTDYWAEKYPEHKDILSSDVKNAILNLEVMPSMRSLMTAGKALDRDPVAGFNCSYIAIDDPKAFDEILYILMCFHPDTEVVTKNGNRKISQLEIGDYVLSYNEGSKEFVWEKVLNVIENNTSEKEKLELEFEDGSIVKCTSDHRFLTEKRGWIEAQNLTYDDEIVEPKYKIYKITNTKNKKSYIGFTSFSSESRYKSHIEESKNLKSKSYNTHFHRAIRKHGENVWDLQTIDFAYSLEEAHQKEIENIKTFDTKNNGYNSTDGGQGTNGFKWSEEQRSRASENAYERTQEHREQQRQTLKNNFKKINKTRKTQAYREAQRKRNLGKNNPRYGKKHTKKWREEASIRNTGKSNPFYGKSHSEGTKKKISEAKKGKNIGEDNPFYGKKHTPETRRKMRETKRKNREERTKEVS